VALDPAQAIRLARTLRDLRESAWSGVELTQAQLAKALSADSRVASATLSSWESLTNPKTPTASRLTSYARFFATRRSVEGNEPRLLAEKELTADELERCRELEAELLGLLHADTQVHRGTFAFDEGPVTIICPEVPEEERGRLAHPSNPNFNKLQRLADLDALLEIWGHVRAENPQLPVRYRRPTEVVADDLSGHVILLGGIAWNRVTRRFQTAMSQMPITQVGAPDLTTGDIFSVKDAEGERSFFPEWDDPADEERELIEDVGHIARLTNPFQSSRTLTICNGIHSRGVYGAVRCLTDERVRDANERYLAERFAGGRFALLVRVPVVTNETLSPDLQNPATRLFEWTAPKDGTAA
jgi:transcriptional regulator with XRE-family HTH domain